MEEETPKNSHCISPVVQRNSGHEPPRESRDQHMVHNTQPKRVKVYILETNEWKDTGTGFCVGQVDQDSKTKDCEAFLLVTNEEVPNNILLKSQLQSNIEYQRQEETLIVWKDVNGQDVALSFEESLGCDALCDFIIYVQRHLENNISLVAVKSSENGIGSVHEIITGPVSLPSNDVEQSPEVLLESFKILNENTSFEYLKLETIDFIIKENYLNTLIKVFHKAESEHVPKALFLLSNIVKTLVLYDERSIIEQMVEPEKIDGIAGILEYDTEFPQMKANHRKSLKDGTPSFKDVLFLENNELQNLMLKCFRLQFLKDVVLVRFLDDHNFNLILEILLDLKTYIFECLQVDPFLDKIMSLFQKDLESDNEIVLHQRSQGIKLLHQCVQISKSLDPIDKSKFYKTLVRKGLLNVLNYAFLMEKDSAVRILGTHMIVTILEHDILLIQSVQNEKPSNTDKTLSDCETTTNHLATPNLGDIDTDSDMSLLIILSTILLNDSNPGLREQVVHALNTLLHPDGCVATIEGNYDDPGSLMASNLESLNDDNTIEYERNKMDRANRPPESYSDFQLMDYFNNFYDRVANILFKPLIIFDPEIHDDNLFMHLVKLITFISSEHDRVISRSFLLENKILDTISLLVQPSHMMQLRLTAVRCFKFIIMLDDTFYTRYFIGHNLLKPVFALFEENIAKDNLANSCIRDLLRMIFLKSSMAGSRDSTVDCDSYHEPNTPLDQTELRANEDKRSLDNAGTPNYRLLSKYIMDNFGGMLKNSDCSSIVKDYSPKNASGKYIAC